MSERSDFEVACLFGAPFITGPGAYLRASDGTYKKAAVEVAYQGYVIGRRHNEDRLKRLSPDRNIAIGHITQINEKLKELGVERPITPEHIRAVLAVMGGAPV